MTDLSSGFVQLVSFKDSRSKGPLCICVNVNPVV